MSRDLTEKQEIFVDKYIETGGNGTEAALAAYDTTDRNTAAVIASENLIKPKILDVLEQALPDHLLAEVHREGLYATKAVFNDKGENVAEDADFNARAKYLDMAYKLRGKYAPDKKLTVHVDARKAPSQRIIDLSKRMNA